MKSAKQLIGSALMNEAYQYMAHDPMKNLPKLIDWAEKVKKVDYYQNALQMFRDIAKDPENNWNQLIQRYFKELNTNTQKKFLINFMVNAGMVGQSVIDKSKEKYDCNVPWAILFDPTAACNLHCTGCWAAEYGKGISLDYATMQKIIRQGKELGIYMYILSGGEPTVRKDEILRLAEENDDCMFLSFTNATLIDEAFASEVERLENFAFAVSVEGYEEETYMRRGKGTYRKVMDAMDILQKHGIIFGFSTCYHSKNVQVVGSEKRKFRTTKPCFLMDFWNDGEYVKGCIAGGRNYLHINSNGDVEPCAFIHYSNVNIKNVDLIDALCSPLFQEYKMNQPFNENHLRPCPMFDNPERIREMVNRTKAHSTQLEDSETVEELTAKTIPTAERWKPVADKLWAAPHE